GHSSVFFCYVQVLLMIGRMCDFLFAGMRRHKRFKCAWSSDVCSSDFPLLYLWRVRLRDTLPAARHQGPTTGDKGVGMRCVVTGEIGRASVGKGVELGGRRDRGKKKERRRKTDVTNNEQMTQIEKARRK